MCAICAARAALRLIRPLAIALAGVALLGQSLAFAAEESGKHALSIDARELSSALIQLSRQTGTPVVFSDRHARHRDSQALVGVMTLGEALDQLLTGSDLSWELVDGEVVAIFSHCSDPQDCGEPEETLDRYPPYAPQLEETYIYGSRLTGSRIRRADYKGSAPVDIFTAPDIELSGAQTLGELLKFVPAVAGNSLSTAISNGGNGTATVTLRGLPSNNTLVLIDGRRVANDGLAGDSVDLNSIPPSAVERIEILKGGASAVYGSDAIAGVVNVIMKSEVEGFQAEAYYGAAEAGDLETRTTNLQWGRIFDRSAVFLSASLYDQEPIYSRDRDISASADTRPIGGVDLRSSATPGARIMLADDSVLTPVGNRYRPATDEDRFDYQAYTTAVVPLERNSLFGSYRFDFNDKLSAKINASYLETDAEATLAPTPIFTGFELEPIVISADNRYNRFGEDLHDVRRRLLEFPERRQRNESEVSRVSAVLEGLSADWNWELAYAWSRSEASEYFSNLVSADNLRRGLGPAADCQGLEIDGCVPVNLLGPAGSISRQQVDYLRVDGQVEGYTELSSLSGYVSRSLPGLSAGRADLALGFEHREESTRKRPDELLANTGTIGGTNFQATRGERDVSEIYGELIAPLWQSADERFTLELEAALRYSDYSDFGDTTNPRLGLKLQLGPSLLLRTSYAEGFRAPSLNELFEGASEKQSFLTDPCAQASNVGALPGCSQQSDPTRNQFLTVKGGNPDLKAETAETWSAGFVWTPGRVSGLTLSADLFSIRQEDVVSSSAQYVVSQNARFGLFEDQVERDENGNLSLVVATNLNAGNRDVDGADLSFNYILPRARWGQLTFNGTAAYIDKYEARANPGAPALDLAGTFRDEASDGLGGIPEWKARLGLRWHHGRWLGSYDLYYVSSMEELIPGTEELRDIDDWIVHDMQLNYEFDLLKGLRWGIGVDNLLDEEPPLATSAFNDNIDGRTHELKGRFWYTRLTLKF